MSSRPPHTQDHPKSRKNGWEELLRSWPLSYREIHFLAADCSRRVYGRVLNPKLKNKDAGLEVSANLGLEDEIASAIMMDTRDEPDVPKKFFAIADLLRAMGVRVPRVFIKDWDRQLFLLEDFGDLTYASAMTAGADPAQLYTSAVDVIITIEKAMASQRQQDKVKNVLREVLRFSSDMKVSSPSPVRREREDTSSREGASHTSFPLKDIFFWISHLRKELLVFLTSYCLKKPSDHEVSTFFSLWSALEKDIDLERLMQMSPSLILRDFHIHNMMVCPGRGLNRCGVLDFQDALIGPAVYDLVSLLQDARLTLPEGLEDEMIRYYREASSCGLSETEFENLYAVLGLQRALKILGRFAVLHDQGKRELLREHGPRLHRLVISALTHKTLRDLTFDVTTWMRREIPEKRNFLTEF